MREENPSGHPGVSASSGDKDLEIRNTRGGAWSRDFRPWICSVSQVSRLEVPGLENQDWSSEWSYLMIEDLFLITQGKKEKKKITKSPKNHK